MRSMFVAALMIAVLGCGQRQPNYEELVGQNEALWVRNRRLTDDLLQAGERLADAQQNIKEARSAMAEKELDEAAKALDGASKDLAEAQAELAHR
jgi:hypothetical protein